MEVVLVHPEIPHNSGCAARLCAALGLRLQLVEPLGFSLEDRYLKRAGLDYWPAVELVVHADWSGLVGALGPDSRRPFRERLRLFSARGGSSLFATAFEADDVLVFGSESAGLPLHPLIWSAALGTDIGGNGTPIGASANVVAVSTYEKATKKRVSWAEYCVVSYPVMVITVLVINFYLLVVYRH